MLDSDPSLWYEVYSVAYEYTYIYIPYVPNGQCELQYVAFRLQCSQMLAFVSLTDFVCIYTLVTDEHVHLVFISVFLKEIRR